MSILDTYRSRHARSLALAEQAQRRFPSGLTHDARQASPFGLYVERSQGSRKWDVDGNELIDYWTGHGSLILGHGHPDVVAAVQHQIERGTHYGAEHELALRWAELVQGLFPSIEVLRFTASGTEATMMAIRLARAYTGRSAIVRFSGHFHGWHDGLAHGMTADSTPPPGVLPAVVDATVVLPTDLAVVEQTLRARADVAAVILEPTGASYGMVPLPEGFLRGLRALTERYGVLLICDEVVTGFRVSPGGEQARAGVAPDITTLAKVLAGGLPGGALGGRADVMRLLSFGDAAWNREQKVRHNGTFNANPLSAAAGVATLQHVADGAALQAAQESGVALVAGMNEVLRRRGCAGWAVYGDGSIFHVLAGASIPFTPGALDPALPLAELKRGGSPQAIGLLRMALVNHGVDLMRGSSGFLSAAHTQRDREETLAGFDAAVGEVLAELGA
ncbi:aminotransferase class III-fold pyridoxal phosphate-dependent enzyme [Chloroflexia bacterium SDU3-3]|nr:aminotransferase class III-fold pyridoxal phosphate-dependent enzyme [Chloroflexia bacterium SDU3-3]